MAAAPSYAETNLRSIRHMKNDETTKAVKATAKNGAFVRMVGNRFTVDAMETDATANKTMKTAVNGLNMLLPVCLTSCFFV